MRPDEYEIPHTYPYGCGGGYFALHQRWRKAVADPTYPEVIMRRYKCLTCGRSFRVHPVGISADHRSQRLRGIGVMLYVLGLRYGGVADALTVLGWAGSKSSIYRDVQAAGEAVPRLRRQQAVRRVEVEQVTVAVATDGLAPSRWCPTTQPAAQRLPSCTSSAEGGESDDCLPHPSGPRTLDYQLATPDL